MEAHPLAKSGRAATKNNGFMVLSEQEIAAALESKPAREHS
ncbi:hypothetical protein SAMCCGM7_pC0185 (plasmid) [Sinorhizobium americanum CCGM7]|nr:hypothetical protein SAMCCGM7_pC0185 [Sinorhizobium americanum CCGM7]